MIPASESIDLIPSALAGTLSGLFAERVRRSPDKTAYLQFDDVTRTWQSYSWTDMARIVDCFRSALADTDLKRGDRVGILLSNCTDWVALDMAAMSLGLVTVPLYVHDSAENIAFILSDAGAKLLATDTFARWKNLERACIPELRHVWIKEAPHNDDSLTSSIPISRFPEVSQSNVATASPVEPSADALATLVYTSGTTGRPKGVMLSHASILWNAEAVSRFVSPLTTDLFLSILPLAHGFERTLGHYLPMMGGSTVAYARSIDSLREDLETIRPTVLLGVPRLYERFASAIRSEVEGNRIKAWLLERAADIGWRAWRSRHEGAVRPVLAERIAGSILRRIIAKRAMLALGGRLRVAVSGGASLRSDVAQFLIGLGLPLVEGYGLTEAGPVVTASTVEDYLPGAAGRPLEGLEMRFSNESELLIRSPGIMRGYWGNESATRRALDADGWLRTGDTAHLREGRLHIDGRLTDTIVLSTGSKIDLPELESCILRDPLFEQVCVVGTGQPCAVMVAVLNSSAWRELARTAGLDPKAPNAPEASSALLVRVSKQLESRARHEQIRGLHAALESWSIENGLLTPTLKVKRRAVEETYRNEIAALHTIIQSTHERHRRDE